MPTPFKNPEDFQRWKETNLWLWDLMARREAELQAQAQAFTKTILICPRDQIDAIRLQACALVGRAGAFQEILDMNFVNLSEVEGGFGNAE